MGKHEEAILFQEYTAKCGLGWDIKQKTPWRHSGIINTFGFILQIHWLRWWFWPSSLAFCTDWVQQSSSCVRPHPCLSFSQHVLCSTTIRLQKHTENVNQSTNSPSYTCWPYTVYSSNCDLWKRLQSAFKACDMNHPSQQLPRITKKKKS